MRWALVEVARVMRGIMRRPVEHEILRLVECDCNHVLLKKQCAGSNFGKSVCLADIGIIRYAGVQAYALDSAGCSGFDAAGHPGRVLVTESNGRR
jgi:hypothetical protein